MLKRTSILLAVLFFPSLASANFDSLLSVYSADYHDSGLLKVVALKLSSVSKYELAKDPDLSSDPELKRHRMHYRSFHAETAEVAAFLSYTSENLVAGGELKGQVLAIHDKILAQHNAIVSDTVDFYRSHIEAMKELIETSRGEIEKLREKVLLHVNRGSSALLSFILKARDMNAEFLTASLVERIDILKAEIAAQENILKHTTEKSQDIANTVRSEMNAVHAKFEKKVQDLERVMKSKELILESYAEVVKMNPNWATADLKEKISALEVQIGVLNDIFDGLVAKINARKEEIAGLENGIKKLEDQKRDLEASVQSCKLEKVKYESENEKGQRDLQEVQKTLSSLQNSKALAESGSITAWNECERLKKSVEVMEKAVSVRSDEVRKAMGSYETWLEKQKQVALTQFQAALEKDSQVLREAEEGRLRVALSELTDKLVQGKVTVEVDSSMLDGDQPLIGRFKATSKIFKRVIDSSLEDQPGVKIKPNVTLTLIVVSVTEREKKKRFGKSIYELAVLPEVKYSNFDSKESRRQGGTRAFNLLLSDQGEIIYGQSKVDGKAGYGATLFNELSDWIKHSLSAQLEETSRKPSTQNLGKYQELSYPEASAPERAEGVETISKTETTGGTSSSSSYPQLSLVRLPQYEPYVASLPKQTIGSAPALPIVVPPSFLLSTAVPVLSQTQSEDEGEISADIVPEELNEGLGIRFN